MILTLTNNRKQMKNIFASEKSFTFNNFDELKGFLKDKYILASSEEENEKLYSILKILEFNHELQRVPIPEHEEDERIKIFSIEDTDFTRDFACNVNVLENKFVLSGEDVIEEYFQLKEQLVYSIIPYPITISEARNMTRERLFAIYRFSNDLIDKITASDLDDLSVKDILGDFGVSKAQMIIDNYEIQEDNLKYIE